MSPNPRVAQAGVLVVAVTSWFIAWHWVTPLVASLVEPSLPTEAGPSLFLRHLLTFSLPTALLCLATWLLLARLGWVEGPRASLRFDKRALTAGLVPGLALVALMLSLGAATNALRWKADPYAIAGNFFSNLWEELEYRGLLYAAAVVSLRRPALAIAVTSLIFGLSHWSHGTAAVVFTTIGGLAFGIGRAWGRSLWSAWIAHVLGDLGALALGG